MNREAFQLALDSCRQQISMYSKHGGLVSINYPEQLKRAAEKAMPDTKRST